MLTRNNPQTQDPKLRACFFGYLEARGYSFDPTTYTELWRGCKVVVTTTDVSLSHFTEVRRRSRSSAYVILAKTDFENSQITNNLFPYK